MAFIALCLYGVRTAISLQNHASHRKAEDLDEKGQCCHIFVLCVTNLLQTYGSSSANLWVK